MKEIAEFYDHFSIQQNATGINNRHISIRKWLNKFGLKPTSKVLELGCGIGTVSELILRDLAPSGFLMATDISPKSLEMASKRLTKYNNVQVREVNFAEETVEMQFDIIVLPDVLEHIPIELHKGLFKNLESMLAKDGFIFIHIPDPNCLLYTSKNNPSELQIIDQPIHTGILANALSETNLYINYLESYSIYDEQFDYQAIQLQFIPEDSSYMKRSHYLNDSLLRRIRLKLKYYLRGKK